MLSRIYWCFASMLAKVRVVIYARELRMAGLSSMLLYHMARPYYYSASRDINEVEKSSCFSRLQHRKVQPEL